MKKNCNTGRANKAAEGFFAVFLSLSSPIKDSFLSLLAKNDSLFERLEDLRDCATIEAYENEPSIPFRDFLKQDLSIDSNELHG